jgi:predicted nuclease with RNAse H fold
MAQLEEYIGIDQQVYRCIVHLAKGSIEKLEHWIRASELDSSLEKLPAQTIPNEFNDPSEPFKP